MKANSPCLLPWGLASLLYNTSMHQEWHPIPDRRYLAFAPAIRVVVEPLDGRFEVHGSKGECPLRTTPAALEVILADRSSRRIP